MKSKKIMALGLVAAMTASMAIGVSASSENQAHREAVSGSTAPSDGSLDIDVEGIIEPTEFNLTDTELLPTDPSKTSDVSSGWQDDVVDDTSQLLVSAPMKMKFVARGNGTAYGSASLITGETTVAGKVRNASGYIPADNGTVIPKTVSVKVGRNNGDSNFNLLARDASETAMKTFGSNNGSLQGLDIKLGGVAVDFGLASLTTSAEDFGTLPKGSITSLNGISPSNTTIAFVENNLKTAFVDDFNGRLVNNYTMTLTFSYNH